jgi:putative glycosyltransferase (TIGR04372 family)
MYDYRKYLNMQIAMKQYIKKFLVKVLKWFKKNGLNIQRVHSIDKKIAKLNTISNFDMRLQEAKQLVSIYPEHPKAQWELIHCLEIQGCNSENFDQLNNYGVKLHSWLLENGLENLKCEFIWAGMVVGSLGNHYAIETLLRANKYGLRVPKQIFLILPENAELRNPTLFSYFEPFINVVRDSEAILAMRGIEALLTVPIGTCLPMKGKTPYLDIAANIIEAERVRLELDQSLFQLKDEHHEMGIQVLNKLGLPKGAWYVTIHVREPGYRGETIEGTEELCRNANPLNYLKACEAVTNAGGWVFRLGDSSMTPMPKMPQVIDYALMDIQSDWMDVFLGATCRFLIGTASGPLRIPRYFGVPVLLTNCAHFIQYYSLLEQDLYLPRLLKSKNSKKFFSFEENMSPPLGMFEFKKLLEEELECLENTPNELEEATIEMLERTGEGSTLESNQNLQKSFKLLAEKCGQKYGGHEVKAFAPISREFLKKYSDLLETGQ